MKYEIGHRLLTAEAASRIDDLILGVEKRYKSITNPQSVWNKGKTEFNYSCEVYGDAIHAKITNSDGKVGIEVTSPDFYRWAVADELRRFVLPGLESRLQ
jgi:hypothetical protein